jgi:hypothetical protein
LWCLNFDFNNSSPSKDYIHDRRSHLNYWIPSV